MHAFTHGESTSRTISSVVSIGVRDGLVVLQREDDAVLLAPSGGLFKALARPLPLLEAT